MRLPVLALIGSVCLAASIGCGSNDAPATNGAGGSAATGGGGQNGGTAANTNGDGGKPNGGAGSAGAAGAVAGAGGSEVGGAAAGGASGRGGSGGSGGSGAGKLTGTPIVFVGGFGASYPVRAYTIDKASGALTQRGGDFDAGTDPSYLALDPSRTHLYAANENDSADGGITALAIDGTGALTKLNHRSGSDKGFTYVAVDPSGKFVLGASYNGGSVSIFSLGADGSIEPELDNVDFGSSSQAHGIAFDKTGQYVLVPTKGADAIQQLSLGQQNGMLSPNAPASVATAAGAGPRHIAVHPSGKLAFVANELSSTLTPYQLSSDGKLTAGTSISMLPPTFSGDGKAAHVELSPDGRFVYASSRGSNTIAVFAADQATGALTLVEHEPTRGSTPRDFDVDPNGDVLIVANQDSATLSVYSIEENGALSPLGTPTPSAPKPSAVQIHYVP